MRTDLGLTYNIEYPQPGNTGILQDEAPLFEGVNEQKLLAEGKDKQILVILLGWIDARDRQLEKYSDIYLKRGCIVMRLIAPASVNYYDYAKLPGLAAQVVNLLKENTLQSHPTFFHAFSNGGAYLYSHILREIAAEKDTMDFDIRGTIFDSAPFSPSAKTAYNAMQTTFKSFTLFGFKLAPVIGYLVLVATYIRIVWVLQRLGWELFTTGTFKRLTSNGQKGEPYALCNFLTRIWKLKNHSFAFLYSETDVITPYEEVEEIAEVIRNRGNPVEMVKFEGSEHVQHYKMYPQEYVDAVTKFIRNTMESYPGPAVLFEG